MFRYLIIVIEGFENHCIGTYRYAYSYVNELTDTLVSDHDNGFIDIIDNKLGCIMTRKKQWEVLPKVLS